MAEESIRPVQPGEMAPDFALPLVSEEGQVSLARYRGRSPLLLAINRGMWCSFCRRYIVRLGGMRQRLEQLGVETLAIVASEVEPVRLYVKHRPLNVPLAADAERITHRAYRLPKPMATAEMAENVRTMRVDMEKTAVTTEDLAELKAAAPKPLPYPDFVLMQRRLYPYDLSAEEQSEWNRDLTLGTGQFLIDRVGIVRWAKVQGVQDAPAGLGNFANQAELLAAAETLTS